MRFGFFVSSWVALYTFGVPRTAVATCFVSGDACDDGLFCTLGDTCNDALECVGLARACTDFRSCTTDSCNEDTDQCDFVVQDGMCLVASSCYPAGTLMPFNECFACDPTQNTGFFSLRGAGTPCDDGLFCSEVDLCTDVGVCVPVMPRRCDDGLDCTVDGCDESADACTHLLDPGTCLIEGECHAAFTPHPQDPCRECDPAQSTRAWSTSPSGAACGTHRCAAGMLTPPGTCSSDGLCVAAATEPCPGDFCADATSCGGTCHADADCPAAAFCDAGACRNDLAAGEACIHPGQCLSNDCFDGTCCTSHCDETGGHGQGGGCSSSATALPGVALSLSALGSLARRRRRRRS